MGHGLSDRAAERPFHLIRMHDDQPYAWEITMYFTWSNGISSGEKKALSSDSELGPHVKGGSSFALQNIYLQTGLWDTIWGHLVTLPHSAANFFAVRILLGGQTAIRLLTNQIK